MSAALAGCVFAAGLTGCSGPAPELEDNAAAQLQQRVLAITSAAAGSDPATALKSLDGLVSELDDAAASGEVSFRRHQTITVAINAVRADLSAAAKTATVKPATPTATPTTPQSDVPAPASGNSGKGKAGADSSNSKGSGKGKD